MGPRNLLGRALRGAGGFAAHFMFNLGLMCLALLAVAGPLVIGVHAGAIQLKQDRKAEKKTAAPSGKPRKIESLTANKAVVDATRRYVDNMVRNNRVQGELLNTYEKAFRNNWNTLANIERRVLENPQALCDPVIREVYEKVQAALDSAQVFSETTEDIEYSAGGRVLQFPDGTTMTVPQDPLRRRARTSDDYSGAARMTDEVMRDLSHLLSKPG